VSRAKTDEPINMPFGGDSCELKKPCTVAGAIKKRVPYMDEKWCHSTA